MITVGNREVIFNHSFIIPVGEEASFVTPKVIGDVKINICFKDELPAHGQPGASWEFADNILRITFHGWKNSLGTAFKKASRLGELSDSRPFGFNAVHYFIGEVHFLTFELYAGGTY